MKKYITICIAVIILILVSCSKEESDDTVRIWIYGYYDGGYKKVIELIKSEITNYAQENNINVEILSYSQEEMSEEDYQLKRNLALEHSNADIVVCDRYTNMSQMSDYAADYTKLENYKNIFDNFKVHYSIPIGIVIDTLLLNNETLKAYGVECNRYITMDEYYEIKQSMKKKGARFSYNAEEEYQLIRYYINKNNLKMIMKDGKYTVDKEIAMKTIKEVSEDLVKNYEEMDSLKRDEYIQDANREKIIFDQATGRVLAQMIPDTYPLKFLSFTADKLYPFDDYKFVINNEIDKCMDFTPCLFINEKTKKDDTYKVGNFLISDIFQRRLYNNSVAFSTIVDTHEVKEKIGYNDDWSYKYEPGKTKIYSQMLNDKDINGIINAVQNAYKILKSTDTEKFYENRYYWNELKTFVLSGAFKMKNNHNYNESEFNKFVDEFLTNFNVQYN